MSEAQLRKARQSIGMIFQHFNLMPSRTVTENIEMPLKLTTLTPAERKAKISSLLELVELSDKADAYPSQLSGGQKQRVAIARALANDPKVLLCDEATSALDPKTTRSILKLLREVNQRLGITIVVITHQMSVVKYICDRAAVMEKGRVVEEGTILEIFSHPKMPVTKGLLIQRRMSMISMNSLKKLVRATAQSRPDGVSAHLYGFFGRKASDGRALPALRRGGQHHLRQC